MADPEEVDVRKPASELAQQSESIFRIDPAGRQSLRKPYCRPGIIESLPVHRAAEMALMSHCPLRR